MNTGDHPAWGRALSNDESTNRVEAYCKIAPVYTHQTVSIRTRVDKNIWQHKVVVTTSQKHLAEAEFAQEDTERKVSQLTCNRVYANLVN